MPAFEYDQLSLQELEQIERDVKKAIASFHDRKRKEAIAKMNEVAKELGFSSATDVLGTEATRKKSYSEVVPFYRNPENHNQVCGKRGRKPAWFNELKKRGFTEDQLKIENQK